MAATKWEREHEAFLRLLPVLLKTHAGQYVAIHEGEVVDSGNDATELALRVLKKVGNVSIHVGLVSEQPERIYRSGVIRDMRNWPAKPSVTIPECQSPGPDSPSD